MKLDLLGERQRTHYCGDLRKSDAGKIVFLAGWVARRRDLGNLIFLDVRDHTGITQVVCNRELSEEAHDKAEEVRAEYVVGVEGEVVLRDATTVNPQLATGEIEVKAKTLLLLNEAKTPPFPIEDDVKTAEETRLQYRYLDLRRGSMQRKLRLRHQTALAVREYMSGHGFIEVETPFMTRSTPEGARDFLVPSRIHHGHFYALPQSPQLFKQLLMIGGSDRYFQIVRCFRDEDFRADRQAEFTQIDIEMAFPSREVLFGIIEGLMEKLFALVGVQVSRHFARLSFDVAMEKYGSDKPHLGFDLPWKRMTLPAGAESKLHIMQPFKALRVPGWAGASRSQLDKLQEQAKSSGADWFAYAKVDASGAQSPLSKIIGEEAVRSMVAGLDAEAGDLVVFLGLRSAKSDRAAVSKLDNASGEVRLEIARRLDLIKPGTWSFLWVIDFPMFEYDEKEKRYAAMHHPFTSPREADLDKLDSDPGAVKALAYDLVLNGSEIGGGSIRIHRQDIQKKIFSKLGLSAEKARERFGFFLDALESGTPPHGGIALGFDRIVALMAGEANIREVIAFPKTASAVDLMCDAPSTVDAPQEEELELMSAYPNLPRDAWMLAEFCDELLGLVDREVLGNQIAAISMYQRAIAVILAKARDDARAAVRLAKSGYGPQSAGICRSLVEASINTRYIQLDPENHGNAFLKSKDESIRRLSNKLALHPMSERLREAIQEAQEAETQTGWPRNIADRAYQVEKPCYDYDVVFFTLSLLLHSDVATLADRLDSSQMSKATIRVGRGTAWVNMVLFIVFEYFSKVTEIACNALGISTDNLAPLVKRFSEMDHARLASDQD